MENEVIIESKEEIANRLLIRNITLNRRRIIADAILIIIILMLGYYIYSNIEFAKSMNGDVCRICEAKTGGVCAITYEPDPNAQVKTSRPQLIINFSEG